MFGYRIPSANQALIISGGKVRGDGPPMRIITGRGAFVAPFIRRAQYLDLSMNEAEVEEEAYTNQGISVEVKAVCAFKVAPDPDSIVNAAQRFLTDQGSMSNLTGRIFAGHLRSIVGSMTVEEIIQERQKLAAQVLEASEVEMQHLGLLVDSFQIESIRDIDASTGKTAGYITAMAAPHQAAIKQAAAIAQAQADQASADAQQQSARQQSNYAKETEILKAQNKAAIDAQQAESEQAGPLATAKTKQAVLDEQTLVAERNAKLTEKQLEATVVKPAEAEKRAKIAGAEASARATELAAQAAAANDRVSLDQLMIEQLPEMIRAAASGFQGANLTILNGGEGVSELFTRIVGEGKSIYDTLRGIREATPSSVEAPQVGAGVNGG